MLHYRNRKNRIYILTLDDALAADIEERIRFDSRTIGVELILPRDGAPGATDADIAAMAKDTITARVIIFDVRSLTLPRLQEPFNRVVGFNRADLNERCFSVCIGDGPPRLPDPQTPIEAFAPLLAQCRIDYSAAAFFYDTLMHYLPEERPTPGIDRDNRPPSTLPSRLTQLIKEQDVEVAQVREYFRAAAAPLEKKEFGKERRQEKLMHLYKLLIKQAFPDRAEQLQSLLSFEGCPIGDEILTVHTYPCCFEAWIAKLLEKAEQGR